MQLECAVILHNVRSAHNVGSVFRTAEAAGAAELVLTGYTPAPIDRFGRSRTDMAKVALGAERAVPWSRAGTLASAVRRFRKKGYLLLALERHPGAIPLRTFRLPEGCTKIALIAGNEVRGLSPQALGLADHILEIPMRGTNESLNVSVAVGVALFSLLPE